MKNRSLFILLVFFAYSANILALFPNDSLSGGGDGTELNPYKIVTAFDLYSVRNAVNVSEGIGVATAYYELDGDIDLTGIDWSIPIGNSTNRFKGKFNGNGYKIIGLSLGCIEIPNTTSSILGFFGNIEDATITDLEVHVRFYYYKSFNRTGFYTFGGLVSTIESGANVIDNCKVSGIISATRAGTNNTNPLRVGGIVGLVNGTATVKITNSNSDVQLNAINTITTTSNGGAYCGGIIGEAITGSVLAVVNSYALGSITARSDNFNAYAGGIIGTRQGTLGSVKIYNCYAANTIDAYGYISTYIGGIIGNCSNLATLEIRSCIALNPHIYAYNTNTTATPPFVNRIVSSINNSNNLKLSDNYALNVMDAKGWQNWTGTSGTSTNPTIASSATGVHGATLAAIDATGQTKTKLNAYVATNHVYENYKLKTWSSDNVEYPRFIQNISVMNSDNYALNAMDIKSWRSWNGTSGIVTSILSVENNLNGITLASFDPAGQTLNNLNNYVQAYVDSAKTKLLLWVIDDTGYPNFNNIISGVKSYRLSEEEMSQLVKYSIDNRNLLITEFEGILELEIFNIIGVQIFSKRLQCSSIIPLRDGVYILLFNGKFPTKIIIK